LVKEEELTSLREFKASIEDKAAEVEKLTSIKEKFSTAGITKTDEYFVEHKDFLIKLSDEALDFLLQELVSFSGKISESSTRVEIPNLLGKNTTKVDTKELVDELNAHFKTK
jgi:hypothetical protein